MFILLVTSEQPNINYKVNEQQQLSIYSSWKCLDWERRRIGPNNGRGARERERKIMGADVAGLHGSTWLNIFLDERRRKNKRRGGGEEEKENISRGIIWSTKWCCCFKCCQTETAVRDVALSHPKRRLNGLLLLREYTITTCTLFSFVSKKKIFLVTSTRAATLFTATRQERGDNNYQQHFPLPKI